MASFNRIDKERNIKYENRLLPILYTTTLRTGYSGNPWQIQSVCDARPGVPNPIRPSASHTRRSMRPLATREFKAAEQQELAIIQRAEGEREAAIHGARGKAEAIRQVNEAAKKYFIGNAQVLKQLEMVENSLREIAKIVITEQGISPTLLLGSLPVQVSSKGETK